MEGLVQEIKENQKSGKKGKKIKKESKKRDRKQSWKKNLVKANEKKLRLSEVAWKPFKEDYELFDNFKEHKLEFDPDHDQTVRKAQSGLWSVPAAEIETKFQGV